MGPHVLRETTRILDLHEWSRQAHAEATRRLANANALILSYLVDVRPSALEKRGEPALPEIGSLVYGVSDADRVYWGLGRSLGKVA